MTSWFTKTPIKIRDEGEAKKDAVPGEKDHDGQYIMEPDPRTGALRVKGFEPEVPERQAWPDDAHVLIKPTVTGGDIQKMQALQVKASVSGDADRPQVEGTIGITHQPLIYAMTFVVGAEGEVFTDDEGKKFEFPDLDDIEARKTFFESWPNEVLWFVQNEVLKRSADPLPATQPVKRSSVPSGRLKIQK